MRVHAALSLAASVEKPSLLCARMLRYHGRLASRSPRKYAFSSRSACSELVLVGVKRLVSARDEQADGLDDGRTDGCALNVGCRAGGGGNVGADGYALNVGCRAGGGGNVGGVGLRRLPQTSPPTSPTMSS